MKISFLGLLTLIFITLKLMGYIAWSWWWVLAPLWLPITVAFTVVMVCSGFLVRRGAAIKTFSKKK